MKHKLMILSACLAMLLAFAGCSNTGSVNNSAAPSQSPSTSDIDGDIPNNANGTVNGGTGNNGTTADGGTNDNGTAASKNPNNSGTNGSMRDNSDYKANANGGVDGVEPHGVLDDMQNVAGDVNRSVRDAGQAMQNMV